ncbi:MAG: hypothetical protein ACYCQI_15590 [Gammaproteobacteria bacterium]
MTKPRESLSSVSLDTASAPEAKGVQTLLMAHISHSIVERIQEINQFVQSITVDPNDFIATNALALMKRNMREMKRCVFPLNPKFQVSTSTKMVEGLRETIFEIIEKDIPNKSETYVAKEDAHSAPVSLEHCSSLIFEKMGGGNNYEKAYNAAISLFKLFNLLRERLLEVRKLQHQEVSAKRLTKQKDSIKWKVIPEINEKRNNFEELDNWASEVIDKFFHDTQVVEEKHITEEQVYGAIKAIIDDETIIKTIGILEFKKIIDDQSRDVGFSRDKLQRLIISAQESRDRGTLFMSKWGRTPATQELYAAIASVQPFRTSVISPEKFAVITDYKAKARKKTVVAEVKAVSISDESPSAGLKQPLLDHKKAFVAPAPKKSNSAIATSYLKTAVVGLVVGAVVGGIIFAGWPALAAASVVVGGSMLAGAFGFPCLRGLKSLASKIVGKIVDWVRGDEDDPITDLSVRQPLDEDSVVDHSPRLSQGNALIHDRLGMEMKQDAKNKEIQAKAAEEAQIQQSSKTPASTSILTSSNGLLRQSKPKTISPKQKDSTHVFAAGFTRF